MQIRVSDEASDNAPTSQDYNGALSAFQAWFHVNSGTFFQETTDYDLNYVRSRCLLDEAGTSYLPASADGFQHTIAMSCQSFFNTDANMISSTSLMREATSHYPINDFITAYLYPMSPTNSPFKSTRNLKLSMLPSGGTNPVPTNPPVPTNVPSPTNAPVSKKTIPVILEWEMAVQTNVVDRQPTQAEYDEFLTQSDAYLKYFFAKHYPKSSSAKLAHFTGGIQSYIRSKAWDASSDRPHMITIYSDVEFERSSTDQSFPTMWEWMPAFKAEGITSFRRDYLGSTTGIFNNLRSIQWRTLNA